MNVWRRWLTRPQQIWLRRALFQVHLWTGIGLGLYILMISVTGSVLVYRGQLYRLVTPAPIIATAVGERLTDDELRVAGERAYPGYTVTHVFRMRNRNQAVDLWLERGSIIRKRLFDPYTGRDLGESVSRAIWFVSTLIDLHDNLLAGSTGRKMNGAGALLTIVLAVTGLVIWWPGVAQWRRALGIRRKVGWRRFNFDLHSAVGIWSLLFVLLFGTTGLYLGFPNEFTDAADLLQPPTDENVGLRLVDEITYWLARAHFGRFGGWPTELIWAVFGLTPALLFVTGAVMWWNRVLRRRLLNDVESDEPMNLAKRPNPANLANL